MALIRPATKKRTSARARVAAKSATDPRGKYAPLPDFEMADSNSAAAEPESALSNLKNEYFGFDGDFRSTKKDKRMIKRGNLLAKVREAGIEKKTKKRRRPNKKLNTNIADLGDALPDMEDDDDEWEGIEENEGEGGKKRRRRKDEGKLVMKSLNMRQGAMKRKKKMEDDEMERMQRNLALLARGKKEAAAEEGGDGQAQRWEALRAFIGGTMQKDQAFAKT